MVGRPEPLGVAFLAPTPPPVMGPSIATRIVLDGPLPRDLRLFHIDTADRRGLETLGRVDLPNIWNALATYARLAALLVRRRPRLVYIPVSQTTIGYLRDSLCILLARLFRRRCLLHLRGGHFRRWYDDECGWLMRGWVRWTLRRTHGVIVLGETLRPLFSGLLPESRIHVVPNGEDYPELDACERRYSGRDDFRILYLGNLIETKGAGELVRAAPALIARRPNTRIILAGEWRNDGFRRDLEAFVAGHGLAGRVVFHGPADRTAKIRLLRDADLLVFPTYYPFEGQPWVVIEALAAGLPVVSTDQGCIRESVIDGRNGRLVPKRDAAALAAALDELLARPAELERMAAASREIHAARHTRARFRGDLFAAMRAAAGSGAAAGRLEPRTGTCA